MLGSGFDLGKAHEIGQANEQQTERKGRGLTSELGRSAGQVCIVTEYVPVVLVGPVAVNWKGP